MTVEELRLVEEALCVGAARGMTLEELRQNVSARILAHELKDLYPDESVEFFANICADFLADERRTR